MEKDRREIEISIVVPVYDEEKNIPLLYEKILKVMNGLNKSYEFIFVDDGSRDTTTQVLRNLFKADPRINIITLRRNFGQTAALSAGFDFARGDIVISMDADLQDDPAEIPNFVRKIEEGFDIVAGWRKQRQESFLFRRLPSWVANRLIRLFSGVKIHDFGCTFRAYRNEVIKNLELSGDLHRFIPAIVSHIGISICEIPIKRSPRIYGRSNYGLSRILSVLYDIIIMKFFISYLSKPMRVFGLLGFFSFAAGFTVALVLTIGYYFFGLSMRQHQGNIIMSVFLMLAGLQFILSGILAEISVRTYRRSAGQKIYYVREVLSR